MDIVHRNDHVLTLRHLIATYTKSLKISPWVLMYHLRMRRTVCQTSMSDKKYQIEISLILTFWCTSKIKDITGNHAHCLKLKTGQQVTLGQISWCQKSFLYLLRCLLPQPLVVLFLKKCGRKLPICYHLIMGHLFLIDCSHFRVLSA